MFFMYCPLGNRLKLYQNSQMKNKRVIASSISVHVEDKDYTTKLLDNPICAETISCLPKIYGPKHKNRFVKEHRYISSEELKESRVASHRQKRQATASFLAEKSPYYNNAWISKSRITFDTDAMETVRSNQWSMPKGLPRIIEEGKIKYENLKSKKEYTIDSPLSRKRGNLRSQSNKKIRNASVVLTERSRKVLINEKKLLEWSSLAQYSEKQAKNEQKLTYFSQMSKLLIESPKRSVTQTSKQSQRFQIPTKQDLPQVIKNYVSLDCSFDLAELITSSKFQIIHFPRGVYIGQVEQGKPHGLGVFFTNRYIFEGLFSQGHKIRGTEKCSEGQYRGSFNNGKREGVGEFVWKNGETYKGMWENGMKHGQGKWSDKYGNRYQGEWEENRQEGTGVFYYNNKRGSGTYRGQFINFVKHGFGQEWLPNGDYYKGEYKQGKPHGQGEYTWKNGAKYSGQFSKGLRKEEQEIVFKTIS